MTQNSLVIRYVLYQNSGWHSSISGTPPALTLFPEFGNGVTTQPPAPPGFGFIKWTVGHICETDRLVALNKLRRTATTQT
ncbi:hypothetical protein GWI33_012235 [Rhynchophorus ferrugineus]|uniref:Uncharacterized protein n=1 Tax=Rhynchophorus ferrugineus TaxID=354439 RepID=A0A834I6T9_RHYFE|nr:hypothetical protein GWI33_012235 [Rhynchophorus ferrugineus]